MGDDMRLADEINPNSDDAQIKVGNQSASQVAAAGVLPVLQSGCSTFR